MIDKRQQVAHTTLHVHKQTQGTDNKDRVIKNKKWQKESTKTGVQVDRWTDTGVQVDWWTGRQVDRWTDRHVYRWTSGLVDR